MNQKLLKTKLKESWALARLSSPCPASLGSDWLLPSSVGEMAMQVFTPQKQRNMKQVMKILLVLLGVILGFAEPVFGQTRDRRQRYVGQVAVGGTVPLDSINYTSSEWGYGLISSSIQVISPSPKDKILFWIEPPSPISDIDFNDTNAIYENGKIGIVQKGSHDISFLINGDRRSYLFHTNFKAKLLYGKQSEVDVGEGSVAIAFIESDKDLEKVVGVPSGMYKTSWWDLEIAGKKFSDIYEGNMSFSIRELFQKARELSQDFNKELTIFAQFSDGLGNYDEKTNEMYSHSTSSIKIIDNRPVLPPPAPKHNVTLTRGVGGLIAIVGKTAQELQAIEEGTTLTVVATPAEGYELVRLMAGNEDITQIGRFVVRSNTEVRAEWRKRTYSVTYTPSTGGTLRITGAANLAAVAHGTELRVEATPADGYELVRLMAGSEDITQSRSFIVRSNTEVRAEWRKRTYSVTYTPTAGGTLRITGAANLAAVAHGTELRVEATPADGYELVRLMAGSEDIKASGRFVVRSNTEVRAEWRKRTYRVMLPSVPHARLSIKGNPDLSAVAYGTELELEVMPDEGYLVDVVRIDGNALTAPYRFTVTGSPDIEVRVRQKTAVEGLSAASLRLYPNPASTYIVVEGAAVGQWVRIYSLGGVLLQESQITEGKQRIGLSSLERGVYLVRLGVEAYRLVLE